MPKRFGMITFMSLFSGDLFQISKFVLIFIQSLDNMKYMQYFKTQKTRFKFSADKPPMY